MQMLITEAKHTIRSIYLEQHTEFNTNILHINNSNGN